MEDFSVKPQKGCSQFLKDSPGQHEWSRQVHSFLFVCFSGGLNGDRVFRR